MHVLACALTLTIPHHNARFCFLLSFPHRHMESGSPRPFGTGHVRSVPSPTTQPTQPSATVAETAVGGATMGNGSTGHPVPGTARRGSFAHITAMKKMHGGGKERGKTMGSMAGQVRACHMRTTRSDAFFTPYPRFDEFSLLGLPLSAPFFSLSLFSFFFFMCAKGQRLHLMAILSS